MAQKRELVETLDIFGQNLKANLHTSVVAKVTVVNGTTIDCRPVVNRMVNGKSIELPVFSQVPIIWPQGGSSSTTYPVAPGDYCLLIFTERAFDKWYSGIDFADPIEIRMHDYSDGFAIVGVNPESSALPIPSEITQTGDIIQNGDNTRTGNTTQTGNFDLTGNLTVDGDLHVSGTVVVIGTVTAADFITA